MDFANEILRLAAEHSGTRPDRIDPSDILGSCGMAGDDADEFLEAFAETFHTDLTSFCSYLHYNANEPPFQITTWAVSPQGKRLAYMPIGIGDLVAAAKTGKWKFDYPAHSVKERGIFRIIFGGPFNVCIFSYFANFPVWPRKVLFLAPQLVI